MVVYAPGILGDLAKTRLLIPCGAVCIGRAPPRIVYAQVLLDCIIQFLAEDLGIAPLQILAGTHPEHCTVVATELVASVEQAGGDHALFQTKHG